MVRALVPCMEGDELETAGTSLQLWMEELNALKTIVTERTQFVYNVMKLLKLKEHDYETSATEVLGFLASCIRDEILFLL